MRLKIVLVLIAFAVLAPTAALAAGEPVILLTPEEGAMADIPPSGLIDIMAGFDTGPGIQVLQPDVGGNPLRPPITILVKFSPAPDRPVDLFSLKVECLKIINIDITKRVVPFATKTGINVENAAFPPGEHRLRITLGDTSGGITQKVFYVKIL
jgi:hypothetical protein